MRRINIYAETNPVTFRNQDRAIGYVIELVDIEGNTVTTCEDFTRQECTWNEGILKAFCTALARLNRPCEIHLYTSNKVILNIFDSSLDGWKENGYRNSKGKEVRNAALWRKLAERCEKHLVIPEEEGVHPYYHWLNDRLKRQVSA